MLNPVRLEEEPQARAKRTSYVAAMGGLEIIDRRLWQEAARLANHFRQGGGG